MLLYFPLFLLLQQTVIALIVVENPTEPSEFRFGQFDLRDGGGDTTGEVLDGTIMGDTKILLSCLGNEWQAELALSIFHAAKGMTIHESLESLSITDEHMALSHALNTCSPDKLLDEKEFLLQVSLSVYPDNLLAAKNLGFTLEWFGYVGAAKEVYGSVGYRLNDLGSLLHEALGTSMLWEQGQEVKIFQDIKDKLQQYLTQSFVSVPDDILYLMRDLPFNLQYLGFPPSELYNLLSQHLYKNFPFLEHAYIDAPSSHSIPSHKGIKDAIRLGVVATSNANSSPGLCLTSFFNTVFKRKKFIHNGRLFEIEVFFFDLPESNTVFAGLMHTFSKESFTLNTDNIHSSVELIASKNLDILMYIALPTEKFTYYLAHVRLAPVQIQFGWGHPFSSGIPSIDYSIISAQMMQDTSSLKELTLGKDPFKYYEQLVTFESQSYYLNDPITFVDESQYTDHIVEVNGTFFANSCLETNNFLKRIFIYPNITAEGIGCISREMPNMNREASQGTYRVYMVMQMYKKIHPAFDLALKGILDKDPTAKFLMMDKARSSIPRMLKIFNYPKPELIFNNFIFVRRTEHHDHLKLMKLSSVFLNTFPYGAGTTSSEAIAMCLPVIVLANSSHTLPLAMSQVIALGDTVSQYVLAHSLQSYIQKAVAVANGWFSNGMNIGEFKNLICRNKQNLFHSGFYRQ